ncbi:hypothetical protein J7T55_015249 [Diaporthe amygdali]|uniref:uncharacterized protein n=1 Tax=Phomopsis amygdali TaxID=1214568 RepID=UPI0022FF118F|nr:uncharacterized protein J7T55_015249 [Diaporthe amygdali]KAJ0120520.1 hypothetical protein J7T55_015249 [Diaporthe amygdali]
MITTFAKIPADLCLNDLLMKMSGSRTFPPPSPPFLLLPPQLRRRVYFWAGLAPVEWDELPCVLDLHGDFDTSRLGFHGLLISCRKVYTEASALLYSLNRFVIRMPPPSPYGMYMPQRTGLAPLRALTDSSLASLRNLKIVISEASCHPRKAKVSKGQCCDYVDPRLDIPPRGCKSHENIPHDGPLEAVDPFTQATLAEWQSTATLLSSRGVNLANLELSFVCDVCCEEPQIARLAVAPLASLAPLKDCHVRLCRESSAEIQEIAQNAVLNARGISQMHKGSSNSAGMGRKENDSSASRLLALPRELRFRILEHTDLITPWKEVSWDRDSSAYSASRSGCYNLEGRGIECAPAVHHGCQFSRCWLTYPEPSIGCFCRLAHSASSSTCRCWGAPKALFLICRTLYHDAQVVFFSGNRFVVHDFDSLSPWRHPPLSANGGYPNQRFAISIFLRDVVPNNCPSLLRFVEIVFPPYRYDSWPMDDDAAMKDWVSCIGWMKQKMNAQALTVRLYMADTSDLSPQGDRRVMCKGNEHEVLKAYTRILGPLAQLGNAGLAKFYAHFVWPWTWIYEVQSRLYGESEDGRRWLADKEAVLKERAERWVMGERYKSLYENDKEPPESLWKLFFVRDC